MHEQHDPVVEARFAIGCVLTSRRQRRGRAAQELHARFGCGFGGDSLGELIGGEDLHVERRLVRRPALSVGNGDLASQPASGDLHEIVERCRTDDLAVLMRFILEDHMASRVDQQPLAVGWAFRHERHRDAVVSRRLQLRLIAAIRLVQRRQRMVMQREDARRQLARVRLADLAKQIRQ